MSLRQQPASWSLFQVGRDVDVTVSFLLFFLPSSSLFLWFKKREIVFFLMFSFLILRSYKFWLSKNWAKAESQTKKNENLRAWCLLGDFFLLIVFMPEPILWDNSSSSPSEIASFSVLSHCILLIISAQAWRRTLHERKRMKRKKTLFSLNKNNEESSFELMLLCGAILGWQKPKKEICARQTVCMQS